MVNLKNVSLTNDGDLKRLSVAYDEFDESGKTIATNQRISRIVTDDKILKSIKAIEDYAKTLTEE